MKEHQDDKESDASYERKLMKQADLEEDDQEIEENNTNKTEVDGEEKSHERVCQICNKKFSSGKALGGHMSSAHVQGKGQKSKSHSKKLMKRKYNRNYAKSIVGYDDFVEEYDEDGDYYSERLIGKMEFKKKKIGFSCRYCGKDFPSKKSLFGHMRCHPDRPYRGMDPPDSNKSDNDDENNNSPMPFLVKSEFEELQGEEEAVRNEENVVDLAQALVGRGWFANNSSSATEKSDSIGNDQTYGDEADCSEEHRLASYLLMHLHNSDGSKSNLDDENLAAGAEEAMRNTTQIEGMEVFCDFAMSKKIASERISNEEEEDEAEAAGVMNQLKNKGRSKAILEDGKDDNSSDETKFDDEFVRKLEYQRTGKGNIVEQKKREKYNNSKKIIIGRKEKLASSSIGVEDYHVNGSSSVATAPPPPPPPPYAVENSKEFRCSYCGKTFSTHQALGGHTSSHNKFKMSVHNTIDENEGNQKMMICGQSPSSKGRRICKKKNKAAAAAVVQKVLDFDLNELPEGES